MEQYEREPTGAELAKALGIDTAQLASYQMLAQPRQVVSFDEMTENLHGEENLPLAERLPDSNTSRPDTALLLAEDRRLILKCLSTLPKAQATVIILHYLQNIPLREVARTLKVTPSRVSQLHLAALGRLKQTWLRKQAAN